MTKDIWHNFEGRFGKILKEHLVFGKIFKFVGLMSKSDFENDKIGIHSVCWEVIFETIPFHKHRSNLAIKNDEAKCFFCYFYLSIYLIDKQKTTFNKPLGTFV